MNKDTLTDRPKYIVTKDGTLWIAQANDINFNYYYSNTLKVEKTFEEVMEDYYYSTNDPVEIIVGYRDMCQPKVTLEGSEDTLQDNDEDDYDLEEVVKIFKEDYDVDISWMLEQKRAREGK